MKTKVYIPSISKNKPYIPNEISLGFANIKYTIFGNNSQLLRIGIDVLVDCFYYPKKHY